MTNKIELLPCPFCGSDVHLSEFEGITSIVCVSGDSCAASKLIVAYPSDDYETALLAWNTRAAPAEDVQCSEVDSQCSEQLRIQAEDVRAVGDEPVGYRARFLKEPDHWMVGWKPLPADLNPHCEYQLLYPHPQRPVVLPERMAVPDADCPERINAQGWNAYDDEYKRLNP